MHPSIISHSRRTFLHQLGAGAACLSASRLVAQQAAPIVNGPRRPVLASYVMPTTIVPETSDEAAANGLIEAMMDRVLAAGLNRVLLFASTSSGLACYDSDWLPARVFRKANPWPLFLKHAKARDLEVWAVPVVCNHGGLTEPKGILRKHPDWALRDAKTQAPIGFISPSHLEARQWLVSWMQELAQTGVDGIHFDYFRYPGHDELLDREGQARLDAVGKSRPAVQAFREQELTACAGAIVEEVRRTRPGFRFGNYTWGTQVLVNSDIGQRWDEWLRHGWLDHLDASAYVYPKTIATKPAENSPAEASRTVEGVQDSSHFERLKMIACDTSAIVRLTRPQATMNCVLGTNTSHGEIPNPVEFSRYLKVLANSGAILGGVTLFPWLDFDKRFAETVLKRGWLKDFIEQVTEA